jgi:hypothetical protein
MTYHGEFYLLQYQDQPITVDYKRLRGSIVDGARAWSKTVGPR